MPGPRRSGSAACRCPRPGEPAASAANGRPWPCPRAPAFSRQPGGPADGRHPSRTCAGDPSQYAQAAACRRTRIASCFDYIVTRHKNKKTTQYQAQTSLRDIGKNMVSATECELQRIPRIPLQTTETDRRTTNVRRLRKARIRAKNEQEDTLIIGGAIRRLFCLAREGATPRREGLIPVFSTG